MKARRTVELGRDNCRSLEVKYSNMKACAVIFGIPVWNS